MNLYADALINEKLNKVRTAITQKQIFCCKVFPEALEGDCWAIKIF